MANSKLARSLRVKLQLRDKKGRWIEMGKGGKWLSLDGQNKTGIVIGSKGNNAIIREKNPDGTLGTNNVEVPMNTLEMIPSKASLDPQTLQLMNEFKEGQSAKGKKESDAREQALSQAMAAESSGQPVQDEVEVEYEASAQEELEGLLDEAPQGAMLLKNNASGQHTLKKNADGSWTDGVKEPTTSALLSNDPGIKDYQYVGTGDTAKKTNEVLAEIANGPAAPVKEKKGWFGKKKKAEPVDPTDALIESTNEKLGLPNNTPEAVEEPPVETPAEPEALIDISAWKYHQGTQGGSNPGGIYSDTEGKQHYVKHSKSDMHAKNEVMADKFYEKLGIKTSQLKLADVGNGKLGTSSEMVPGSKNDFYNKYKSDPAYLKKFQEDFAADAWLANWDVVGLEYDNVLSDANGDATRIDPGGALLYRAMGSPKGDMFGPEVGEWESMRKGSNPASNVFGSMTDEDLKNSVAKLKNITDEDIASIVDSMDFEQDVSDYLKSTLSARRQNLLNKFPELANEEQTDLAEPSIEEAPEAVTQTAKPEPIDAGQVVGTDTPFVATPEDAPEQDSKEAFKAKKEEYRAAALAGEKLDFSDIPSQIVDGDKHYEDYWEEEGDVGPDFAGHFESYTIAEADALGEYVAGSDDINGMLRGNKGVYNHLTKDDLEINASVINKLDELIAKSVVQKDTTVYRGIAMKQSTLDSFLENGAYEDLAYSSTSKEYFLANSWSAVDPAIDPDRVQVVLEMKLPAGFNAHKVDYLAADKKSYSNEKEVLLPRGTKFAIVASDLGTEPDEGKARSVVLTVEPILNDSNYKPEGIKNGQGSNNTTESGDGNSAGSADSSGETVSDDSSGGGYENPSEGADTDGEGAESGSEGVQDAEVAPSASSDTENTTPAGNDQGEEIPVINGAKAMLSQMAKKQGISVEKLQNDLGLPADGAFPNKGKTVTNDNGDVFEANSIVSNPKFGEGIASIILPSTNSVKVLYADHGFKVTQAKNLNLVSGTAPKEVASQAVDLSGANPGDVGTNAANGKMYFVDKNGNAKYVGDEVEYTKKGVTQHGKVASIYKGTKTAKVEWDDDTASVKKASQLIGKDDSSENTDTSEPQEDTTQTPETPVETNEAETPVEETAPEPVEEAPEAAPEASETDSDTDTPTPVEEAVAVTPEATENKGWTPVEGYDPMGPTKVQVHPDFKTAVVYPHDNSGLDKNDYQLKNKVGYNPIEEKFFGTGHNLQPLYAGDNVEYLFNGKKFSGEIIEVKPKAQSAVVLLDDGTKKLKKFSQLSGNYPKTVSVDENGNYTDWHGNAAQIPNIKGSESTSDEGSTPDEPVAAKAEWAEILKAKNGTSLDIDESNYVRISGSYFGDWWDTYNGIYINSTDLFTKYDKSNSVTLTDAPASSNLFDSDLEELGNNATISSAKLGLELKKDVDGEWYHHSVGYLSSEGTLAKLVTDDWVIDNVGDEKPVISSSELDDKSVGQILNIDGTEYVKAGDSDEWWSKDDEQMFSSNDIVEKIVESGNSARFGDELSSNLSEDELISMHSGAEISSEKLGITITKDSDDDWTAVGTGVGYFDDDIVEKFVTDDWVIDSTGSIDPNYSEYDLDSANQYSEIYSSNLEKTFSKESDSDSWTDDGTGISYSASELLSEFPTDDWSLTESEIDENYSYGNADEITLSTLKLGSKLSFTESAHDSPDTYIKVGENEWAPLSYDGKPNLTSTETDDSFEEGYSAIEYEAVEDEYEKPRPLNITSNTEDIASEDISMEWLESAPTGTAFKSDMSEKWTYIKNEEGKWVTTDPYGEKFTAGTSEQVFNISKDKHNLVNVFVPSAGEDAAPEETPEATPNVADLEIGTFIPQVGSTDSGFTKIGDNQWKMKAGDQEIDHVLDDNFIKAFQDATNAKPQAPSPATQDDAESITTPDSVDTPEAVDTPDLLPVEDINIEALPNILYMLPSEFDAIPVGSKMFKTEPNVSYVKVSDTEPEWEATSESGSTGEYPSEMFHSLLLDETFGKKFKLQTIENQNTALASNADTATAPKPTNTNDISFDEFKELPVGTKIKPTWGSAYEKTGDGVWTASATGTEFKDGDFSSYVGGGFNDGMEIIHVEGNSSDTDTSPTTKSLTDTTKEEILNAPVGSVIKNIPANIEYIKDSDGIWKSPEPEISDDDGSGIAWIVGKSIAKDYTLTTGGDSSKAKTTYPDKLSGFTNKDDFDKLPIGTTMGTEEDPSIFTKTAPNNWATETNPNKYDDTTFHYLIETGTGDAYKITVPEDGVPVDNTPTTNADKVLTGITLAELENAPVGSTITKTGPGYNSGVVLTKNTEGTWTSSDTGVAADTSEQLMWFSGNPEQGDQWTFHSGDGTSPTEPEKPKTFADITEAEYKALPAGTTATFNSVVITKQQSGNWVSSNGTHYDGDFIGDIQSDSNSAKDWVIASPSGETATASPNDPGTHTNQKLTKEMADNYPVGTIIKKEVPAYYGSLGQFHYVKQENGEWQQYKQTDKTLSAKLSYQSSYFNNWSHSTASVSVPKSGDHFVSHTGELGYVGDTIEYDGSTYKATKIMKTGVKLSNGSETITVKPSKLNLHESNFGKKVDPAQATQQGVSTPSVVDSSFDSTYLGNTSSDFAGASADEYNAQGLLAPVHEPANLNVLMQLLPAKQPDLDDPLYGAPQPEEPAKPNAYPEFVEPKLELPEWDSEAWMAKVEQRYLDNPNKAKATVQDSQKWTAIQSVLKGDKSNLDNLLSSKYLDEDLYNEAVSGIDAKQAENAPLIEAHAATIEDAKEAYDDAKAAHLANYTALKDQYDKDSLAWIVANPDPNAKQLPKKPATSKENFLGGEADWSKSHLGTFTGDSVFAAIKGDNAMGRHGLGIATDSDKIEGLNVFAYKILGTDGEEKLDFRFGVTKEHGNKLHNWFKNQPNVTKQTKIYTPNLALNAATGLNKEQVGSNQNTQGHRYEYTHEETGARIIFQRAYSEKDLNNDNNHNTVRIVMPATAGTAQYQEVLEHLGISGKPASEGDIRVLSENKLIQSMSSGADVIGDDNLKGEKRKKALADIEKEFGVTPDNVVFRADVNGRVRALFDTETVAKLSDRFSDIKIFGHNLSSSTNIEMWESLLTGSHPGLLSTYSRWSNGVGFSGMSSSQDLHEGSGDSPFLTPHAQHLSYGHGTVGIHPSAVIQHLDLWVNKGDFYGKKGQGTYGNNGPHVQMAKHGANFHEAMVRDGVPLSDMSYIMVEAPWKKKLIEMLKKKGILKINGFELDDFFVSGDTGQKPPKADYIPGFGVVPAGTTLEQALSDPSFGLAQPSTEGGADAIGGGPAI